MKGLVKPKTWQDDKIKRTKNQLKKAFISTKRYVEQIIPTILILYLPVAAFSSVILVQLLLTGKIDWGVAGILAGVVFGLYGINRYTDVQEDFVNDKRKVFTFYNQAGWLYSGAGAILACYTYLVISEKLHWFHIAVLALGLCYSVKCIPWYSRTNKKVSFLRAKEIIGVKNLIVASLWSAGVFGFPLLHNPVNEINVALGIMLAVALFHSTLANTVFNDILDRTGDKVAGCKTLPVLFGERATLIALLILNMVWLAVLVIWQTLSPVNHLAFLLAIVMAVYPFSYMIMFQGKKTKKSLVELFSETDLLVFGVGLIVIM